MKAIGRSAQWAPPRSQVARGPHAAGVRAPGQAIPDYLAAALGAEVSNVVINSQINRDYLSYGTTIQKALVPGFQYPGELGSFIPNWFPIAFHVSATVGDSMAGALAGLELLEEIEAGRLDPEDALVRLGAPVKHVSWLARLSRWWLRLLDIPHDLGTVLFAALRMNYGVLWRPQVLFMSVRRLKALLSLARGATDLDRAQDILTSTVHMLGSGNQAVYLDIGVAFESLFRWQADHRYASGIEMIEAVTFDVDKQVSRRLFELAAMATTIPYPILVFAQTAPAQLGRTLLLASAALYQQASRERDLEQRRTIVRSANALLALREQRDLLQPAFDTEHEGREIFGALTPMLRVHFGRVVWNYSSFQLDPLVGNWGLFEDRWPAIMDAFEMLYADADAAWEFPDPYAEWLLELAVLEQQREQHPIGTAVARGAVAMDVGQEA